uniref:Uncharacterized protein n=1 Tax=Timema poppense TaxID=170557 RepID=A0A7R9DWH5_TIMPO|nr:unnamed protein product [Timema poppensis]
MCLAAVTSDSQNLDTYLNIDCQKSPVNCQSAPKKPRGYCRPCFKLVGFGPDQPPVARLHLTWLPLGFYPTSTRLLKPQGTPLGGEDRIK